MLKFKLCIRTVKKGTLNTAWLLVPDKLVWGFQELLGVSRTDIFIAYRGWSEKETMLCWCRQTPLSWCCRKAIVTQITTHYNKVFRRASLNRQQVKAWSRLATSTEDHSGNHYYHLRTGKWGSSPHRLSKAGKWRNGKMLPVSWVLVSAAAFRWYSQNFALQNFAFAFTKHHIYVTASLSIITYHAHPFMVTVYLILLAATILLTQRTQNSDLTGFLNMNMSLPYLNGFHRVS